jgi:two-component system cell cycle sensor histidine kinase/response regulator CckA
MVDRESRILVSSTGKLELTTLFRTTLAGILITRARDGMILDANEAFVRVLGWPRVELVGRTVAEVGLFVDVATLTRVEEEFKRTGGIAGAEVRARHKSGATRDLLVTVGTADVGGERCAIGFWEDITERRRVVAALQESEDELGAIFDAAPIGIGQADPRTQRWMRVNDRLCAITGYTAAEMCAFRISDITHPDDAARDREVFHQITRGEASAATLEKRYIRKDGRLAWVELNIRALRDAQGRLTRTIATVEDVTERKRDAEALEETEEHHRLALDAAELGTWRHDIAEDALYLDERAQRQLGIEGTVVTMADLFARVHPDDLGSVRATIGALRYPGAPPRALVEHRVVLPSGDVRWVSVHLRGYFAGADAGSAPKFTIATTQDITDAKNAAQAFRASEERYRTLVDNLDDVMFSVDLSGVVTFVSRSINRFGYRPDEIVGRPLDDFVHSEDRAQVRQGFAARIAGTTNAPQEFRWVDAGGKIRFLRNTTRPLVIADRIVGLTGLAADVTRQRETEEQLRAAQRMEAIGRLAGGVAHDFNNMLCVILSYAELGVMDLREEDPLRADLVAIADAAKRAEGLTRQLLAFSRRQILQPEPLHLGELVSGLTKMLRRLIGEDIALEVVVADDVSTVRVDRGQIEQVVMNLTVNARDAMPTGGELRVTVDNARLEGERAAGLEVLPGDYVELTVADTGAGMEASVRARIFEPFFTTKGIGKGTGLGLSMVHGIVKQSGGGITVETSPGRGAAFHIFLPRYVGATFSVMSTRPGLSLPTRGTENVLVVEDESALRGVVKRVLSAEGYKVYVAANPGEALLLSEQLGSRIALVLTDVVMPGMSGPELVERLAPLCPTAKVIFMSGYTDELLEKHGVLGQHFVRKPFDRATLSAKVRSVIDS